VKNRSLPRRARLPQGRARLRLGVAAATAAAALALVAAPAHAAGETLTAHSGSTPQFAALGAQFTVPLCVDITGGPASGPVSVTYTANPAPDGASGTFAGGGSTIVDSVTLTGGDATCGSGGYNGETFTANSTPGAYTVTAVDSTNSSNTVTFNLNNGAYASAGMGQTAKVNTAFTTNLQVTVPGAPPGTIVTFTAPSSGASGTFSGANPPYTATATTNAQGVATAPTFTANSTAGPYPVTASTASYGSATFSLTNSAAGVASGLSAVSGSGQSAAENTAFASPLEAQVLDANGNPVQNANVSFSVQAGSGGAGATFAGGGANTTVQTNSSGIATTPTLTANGVAGSFTVVASTSGVTGTATYSLTVTAGSASTVTPGTGTSQATPIGTPFPVAFAVTVTDANKNPIVGTPVTFTAPSSGASGTFAGGGNTVTVNTDSNGVAVAPQFTANLVPGGYIVTASVPGINPPAAFSLVNQASSSSAGYWLVSSDGGVFSYGTAHFYGSAGAIHLARPIVGMAATPDGGGYWLVASDGGIFTFGDARFFGSTGAERLAAPIVGMAATPDGGGYWLVASDGGIFTFGDARFHGSTGAEHLVSPIIGISPTADGGGYTLAASDGGIFTFGDAGFYGSASAAGDRSVHAFTGGPGGAGYYLGDSSGVVFGYGSAAVNGSPAGSGVLLAAPIVGMARP